MKLTDYQHLESLAAKRGAILVDTADLLAWREEMERLRAENERLYSAYLEQRRAMREMLERTAASMISSS